MTARRSGFSLLEVMVALAILAAALMVISEIEGNAILKTNDAKQYTVATLLARGKILDVEQTLQEEGFGDFMKVLDGDFDDEGFPDFKWAARVRKVQVPTPADMPTETTNQAVDGSGGMSLGTLAPMLQNLGSVLENAVRELEVRVYWQDGVHEEFVSVVTHVVSRDNLMRGMLESGLSGGGLPPGGGLPTGGGLPPGGGLPTGGGLPPGLPPTFPPRGR